MVIKKWISYHSIKKEKSNVIELNIEEENEMSALIKPINATVEITETKIIQEICESLLKKPSEKIKERNNRALALLRKARRG